jgi:hypothetical protein
MESFALLKLIATVLVGVSAYLFGTVRAFDEKYGKPKGDRRRARQPSGG